jgi:hypothetical protein
MAKDRQYLKCTLQLKDTDEELYSTQGSPYPMAPYKKIIILKF